CGAVRLTGKTLPSLRRSAGSAIQPVDGISACSEFRDKQTLRRLEDNAGEFERIDQAFSRGDFAEKLEGSYTAKLIKDLKDKKRDDEPWYADLEYKSVISSKKSTGHIELKEGSFTVDVPSNPDIVISPSQWSYRLEGDSLAKRRRIHFLVFAPDEAKDVAIRYRLDDILRESHIDEAKQIRCFTEKEGAGRRACTTVPLETGKTSTFAQAKVDRYTLSIAVIKTDMCYFDNLLSRSLVRAKNKPSKCCLDLSVVDEKLVFNPSGKIFVEENLAPEGQYSCHIDQCLTILVDDAKLDEDTSNVRFSVSCGGCPVPFSVSKDVRKIPSLTPETVYREKITCKQSFRLIDDSHLQLGAREFSLQNRSLIDALAVGKKMVQSGWLSMSCNNGEYACRSLSLPQSLRDSYNRLIEYLRHNDLLPTLTYFGTEQLKPLVEDCAEKYAEAISSIREGASSQEYADLLEIGAIYCSAPTKFVTYTPLHPLNLAYQLKVIESGEIDAGEDPRLRAAVSKLGPSQMLPMIRFEECCYAASDSLGLPEWSRYYPLNSDEAKGSDSFIARLVTGKIEDYLSHFAFLFEGSSDHRLKIACHDLGKCEEVFVGIVGYLFRQLDKNQIPSENIIRIHVDCYGSPVESTAFEYLFDQDALEGFLIEKSLINEESDYQKYEFVLLLLEHLSFSLHDSGEADKQLSYSHIAFVAGSSEVNQNTNLSSELNTGIMLSGAIGVEPTTNSNGWFKSGFGTKFAKDNEFLRFVSRLNSLQVAAYSSSPFQDGVVLTAAVNPASEKLLERIYDASNWVVLIDPKVDPSYFHEKEGAGNLLIIYYTDQESSNGYDAITVTKKSAQYESVIREALAGVANGDMGDHVRDVVNFANAFNGTWLLSFLASAKNNYVPRSRMSTLAAVKASVAHYAHDGIVWVPLSLEEILRVSSGLGLSPDDELLSWKNSGRSSKGPKSDDILLVGVLGDGSRLRIVLHPVEVKVGHCNSSEIDKGVAQASATYSAFMESFWGDEIKGRLSTRIARNSFMQKVLISASKMKMYEVFPAVNWNWLLDDCREALQNEDYEIITANECGLPKGTVCAFKDDADVLNIDECEGIKVITIPSITIPDITVGGNLETRKIVGFHEFVVDLPAGNVGIPAGNAVAVESSHLEMPEKPHEGPWPDDDPSDSASNPMESDCPPACGGVDISVEPSSAIPSGIKVLLGEDRDSNGEVLWEPCDTSRLFHTNTGIIGTMGTGKTQFTKSLVAQIYANRFENPGNSTLGILIFDYKGDYNSRQHDFIQATNATVYKPYHLPFNPLSINRRENDLPLLPKHVANTFKDTLVRACSSSKLGAIQESILYNFIMKAYELKQIKPDDEATWDRVPPTFETVYRLYMDDEDTKKNDSLAAIMDKVHEFEIFESDPLKTRSLYDMLDGVVVVDLSGYDQDIQNLVVGITVDLFYSQMHSHGHSSFHGNLRELTKMILVDEADNFLSQGFPSLKRILKEGREFGVGTILSTQFLKHFKSKEDDYSKYILTWVVHNVADLDPSDIRFVFNTEAKSPAENYLFNEVKQLAKHCSIVKMGEGAAPISMRDRAFWEYWRDKNSPMN
ncbi:DUF87 domain-containing protein, partial [Adlercreutzia sp. R7]|nr:DUF87 domain-containing protein [Adlercreutzia sp. R7]